MKEWKEFPLNVPDPGLYLVALRFLGKIRYWVCEWKYGEWVGLYEDDKVLAFQEITPYNPDIKQGD